MTFKKTIQGLLQKPAGLISAEKTCIEPLAKI
jgi:hypothetical protein